MHSINLYLEHGVAKGARRHGPRDAHTHAASHPGIAAHRIAGGLTTGLLLALLATAPAFADAAHPAGGNGAATPGPSCTNGQGETCTGGNSAKPGGGACSSQDTGPCGRNSGGTLNSDGNVPGCDSGDALDQNPHCAGTGVIETTTTATAVATSSIAVTLTSTTVSAAATTSTSSASTATTATTAAATSSTSTGVHSFAPISSTATRAGATTSARSTSTDATAPASTGAGPSAAAPTKNHGTVAISLEHPRSASTPRTASTTVISIPMRTVDPTRQGGSAGTASPAVALLSAGSTRPVPPAMRSLSGPGATVRTPADGTGTSSAPSFGRLVAPSPATKQVARGGTDSARQPLLAPLPSAVPPQREPTRMPQTGGGYAGRAEHGQTAQWWGSILALLASTTWPIRRSRVPHDSART